ncbi:hypothetical protein GEMRC1_006386 [Eukaryota sp. GEM-RC1]
MSHLGSPHNTLLAAKSAADIQTLVSCNSSESHTEAARLLLSSRLWKFFDIPSLAPPLQQSWMHLLKNDPSGALIVLANSISEPLTQLTRALCFARLHNPSKAWKLALELLPQFPNESLYSFLSLLASVPSISSEILTSTSHLSSSIFFAVQGLKLFPNSVSLHILAALFYSHSSNTSSCFSVLSSLLSLLSSDDINSDPFVFDPTSSPCFSPPAVALTSLPSSFKRQLSCFLNISSLCLHNLGFLSQSFFCSESAAKLVPGSLPSLLGCTSATSSTATSSADVTLSTLIINVKSSVVLLSSIEHQCKENTSDIEKLFSKGNWK